MEVTVTHGKLLPIVHKQNIPMNPATAKKQHRINVRRRLKVAALSVARRRKASAAATDYPHNIVPAPFQSSRVRLQKLPPGYEVMKLLIPLLFSAALIMYQTKPDRLITEKPAPLLCFVVSTSVYWLIVRRMKHMPDQKDSNSSTNKKWFPILSQVARVSEVVSPSSLISIILKKQLPSYWFWIVVGVGVAWLLFYSTYIFRVSIYAAIRNFCGFWMRVINGAVRKVCGFWMRVINGAISQVCGFWMRGGKSTDEMGIEINAPSPTSQLDHVTLDIPESVEESAPQIVTMGRAALNDTGGQG